MPYRRNSVADVWAKVDRRGPNECWLFRGAITSGGYRHVWYGGVQHRAHRLVYRLTRGAIPHGMFVCHTCDTPGCVNPAHLWLGTNAANMADKARKGRSRNGCVSPRGERNARAKLTEAKVRIIREFHARGLSIGEMAKRLGVGYYTISCVVDGKTWRHVIEQQ